MRLYDPTSTGAKRRLARAAPLGALEGRTIGILHNSKLNAPEMLGEIAALFVTRHGCKLAPLYVKSNASAPAPAGVLAKVAKEVDFLITGLGD